jgi:hypothetical protein
MIWEKAAGFSTFSFPGWLPENRVSGEISLGAMGL